MCTISLGTARSRVSRTRATDPALHTVPVINLQCEHDKHDTAIHLSLLLLVYSLIFAFFCIPFKSHLPSNCFLSQPSPVFPGQIWSGCAFFYDYFHKMPPHSPHQAGLRTPIPGRIWSLFAFNHRKQEEQFIWQETCLLKRSRSHF